MSKKPNDILILLLGTVLVLWASATPTLANEIWVMPTEATEGKSLKSN